MELYQIRAKLIEIFRLINERERKVNEDLNELIAVQTTNASKLEYLKFNIRNIQEISERIILKIKQLQQTYQFIGNSFYINDTVFFNQYRII